MLNFNWWVNRKDPAGRNVFAGGFLGLDNIGVFDRSAPLPTGGSLEQADGTAWMAFYCQMHAGDGADPVRIRPDVRGDRLQVPRSTSCGSPTPWTASATTTTRCGTRRTGSSTIVLRLPDGEAIRLKVRSMVGLLPLCASTVFEGDIASTLSEADGDDRAVPEASPGAGLARGADRRGLRRYAGAGCCRFSTRTKLRARARLPARRERVPRAVRHPLALAVSPRPSVRVLGRRPGVHACSTCRPNRTPGCSAGTRTGVGRSGCRSMRSSSGRC